MTLRSLGMKARRIGLCLSILLAATAVFAQTTAINYQGKLNDGASAAEGAYQMRFRLFDAPSGGAQVGPTLADVAVTANQGIVSARLDFGAAAFAGGDRFLEISVRRNSGESYVTLSPREPITSAPYSIRSLSAAQADSATNAQTANSSASFTGPLNGDVTGTQNATTVARLQGRPISAAAPTAGQVLKYNGATSQWQPDADNVASGGGGVGGNGTVGRIPVFTGSTTVGDSLISQSGGALSLPSVAVFAPTASGHQTNIGTPNSETGITFSGPGARADIRYNGVLKIVNGPGGIQGPGNGITIGTDGRVGVGTAPLSGRQLQVNTSDGVALGASSSDSVAIEAVASGARNVAIYALSIGSTGVYGASLAGFDAASGDGAGVVGSNSLNGGVGVYGKVSGINSAAVRGDADTAQSTGVIGIANAGTGVTGQSSSGNGVFGSSVSGLAGNFAGRVRIGTFDNGGTLAMCLNASNVIAFCSSSMRYKKAVSDFRSGLTVLNQLRPVTFDWKSNSSHDLGLVAEEVAKAEPLLTFRNDKGEIEGVRYDRVGLVLINAVKELEKRIEAQERRIESQQQQITKQRRQIRQLKCSARSRR
jgi:hypothetical protein